MAFAVNAAVTWLPLAPSVPDQPPDAVQAMAFVELHVNVEVVLYAMLIGAAFNVAVGAGATVTTAEAAALVPPAPLHVSVKVVVAVTALVALDPLAASEPVQPPLA